MYGATSFVGVIQVIHRAAGTRGRQRTPLGRELQSGGAAVSVSPRGSAAASHSLTSTARIWLQTTARRTSAGTSSTAADEPAGRRLPLRRRRHLAATGPREPAPARRARLSPLVPLDANHNPGSASSTSSAAPLGRLRRALGVGRAWSPSALSHSARERVRGFLPRSATRRRMPTASSRIERPTTSTSTPTRLAQLNPRCGCRRLDHLHGRRRRRARTSTTWSG